MDGSWASRRGGPLGLGVHQKMGVQLLSARMPSEGPTRKSKPLVGDKDFCEFLRKHLGGTDTRVAIGADVDLDLLLVGWIGNKEFEVLVVFVFEDVVHFGDEPVGMISSTKKLNTKESSNRVPNEFKHCWQYVGVGKDGFKTFLGDFNWDLDALVGVDSEDGFVDFVIPWSVAGVGLGGCIGSYGGCCGDGVDVCFELLYIILSVLG